MKRAGPDKQATRNAVRARIHHHTSQALPDSTRHGTNYPCIDFVYFVMQCDVVSSWLPPQAAWMSRSTPALTTARASRSSFFRAELN